MRNKAEATLENSLPIPSSYSLVSEVFSSDFSIIDVQDDFIVINKAPGVDVHRDGEEAGICEKVAAAFGLEALFLVHRLDKVTSGLLILARSSNSCAQLAQLFKEKTIQKYYLALADKKPKKKQGWIKGDMQRSRRSSWKLVNSQNNPAVTQFFTASVAPGIRAFLLKPLTGKTHQLRVAMKSLGAPICGDLLYSDVQQAEQYDRTYLHAYVIAFELGGVSYRYCARPEQGKQFLTTQFQSVMENWQTPEALSWPT